ncbi:acetyl-CoA carboxylase biotin carboxyl carrier protein [Cellulosilyticum sp. I15G10I2]|uniref:acetyl-CoA carboxylase biotin carboxyl carrier protein n=1 Tax=Cellulosilyticum sp. I15G10I2 TaxID=1892843 RepID=UPI00085C248F|nr:acetyl-CoA carboxylase biotin carboxyl carrier protein [Cellulosilyticum sp. I15G10I2]
MDIEIIKQLVNEFKEADLTKLSLKCDTFEINLEKEKEIVQIASSQVVQPAMNYPTIAINNESDNVVIKKEDCSEKKQITSPMVGTFYASSTPGGAPFVTVGSKIKKGDVICIIEAMKLMNEVEAEVDGEIVEVLVKNEQMVEYAQPLFVIK